MPSGRVPLPALLDSDIFATSPDARPRRAGVVLSYDCTLNVPPDSSLNKPIIMGTPGGSTLPANAWLRLTLARLHDASWI